MFAHPDSEIAIVDVHDPASNRDLGRHPAGDERGTAHHQDAVSRMRDFEVGEVPSANFVQIAFACRRDRPWNACRSDRLNKVR